MPKSAPPGSVSTVFRASVPMTAVVGALGFPTRSFRCRGVDADVLPLPARSPPFRWRPYFDRSRQVQPWQVSLGVSLASLVPLYLLVSHELTYLAPFWPLVWSRFGFHLVSVVLMVYLGVMFGVYQVTRVLVMGERRCPSFLPLEGAHPDAPHFVCDSAVCRRGAVAVRLPLSVGAVASLSPVWFDRSDQLPWLLTAGADQRPARGVARPFVCSGSWYAHLCLSIGRAARSSWRRCRSSSPGVALWPVPSLLSLLGEMSLSVSFWTRSSVLVGPSRCSVARNVTRCFRCSGSNRFPPVLSNEGKPYASSPSARPICGGTGWSGLAWSVSAVAPRRPSGLLSARKCGPVLLSGATG